MTYRFFRIEREVGNIAIVCFDRPDKEMNVLSIAVCHELNSILDTLESDPSVEGLVLISGKKDFIAGADIADIQSFKTADEAKAGAKQLQDLFGRFSRFRVPTVAAIHGACMGGGLELSLACNWRIATDDPRTKLALPEIQLGLIPGAGGTQRLPRLIGIQAALDMILTGKRIAGKKALKLGLVDKCVPPHLLREQAVMLAQKSRKPVKRMPELDPLRFSKDLPRWATEGNLIGRKVMAKKAREMVDQKTKGFYPASYKALEAVFDGFETSLEKGLDLESDLFGQLAMTRESQSLTHLFHATTKTKKNPYEDATKKVFGKEKLKTIGVIGAGFMGAGIATVAADRGIRTLLSDPNKDSVSRCMKHVKDFFRKQHEKRKIKAFEANQKVAHVSPALSTQGFSNCDIAIEAVFEDVGLKRKILANLESSAPENFIFASNTSAIPISEIAAEAKHPDRVIGLHFFSPVEKMPLLEIVVTPQTADWVTGRSFEFGQALGKQIIIVKDSPGFYTTRALAFFLAEAASLLAEGAQIERIDKALTDFGFPVGPITLIDEVGIDVGLHVLNTMEASFPERISRPEQLKAIADSGRLGRKNSRGFYLYQNGKKGAPDNSIYEFIQATKPKEAHALDEMATRCVLAFVNESARCLEEGVLGHAYDGDVGAVFGLGFPPFWGGPFKYVDHVGAKTVVDRLRSLEKDLGERFKPARILLEHAEGNKPFFADEPRT
jgi:3-hydroxyacyl-CoA dehydrogenase/enoyl-CoA hydratase/3-hydroxybutyryl-CoA epimerase